MKPEPKKLTAYDIKIGVTIAVCMLVCFLVGKLGYQIQMLAACTGAVMCAQDNSKASWKATLTRLTGVVIGGVIGVIVVILDNVIGVPYVFFLLCGVGVAAVLVLCKLANMMYVQCRVSCITFLLVVLVLQGEMRVNYALARLIGTIIGGVVAIVVAFAWEKLGRKK